MNTQARSNGQLRVAPWFCIGLVLGLLLSILIAWHWLSLGKGTEVSVLGSGKYVSVLITHNHRRVLIASGSNGSAFSNALGKALPPIDDEIDVLLLDPRASADVIDRARSLSVKTVMRLPDRENPNESQTVQRSFVMDLGDGISVSVRVPSTKSWTAIVETPAGRIAITPESSVPLRSAIHVSLDGSISAESADHAAIEIGPAVTSPDRTARRAMVSAGTTLPIIVAESGFRISRNRIEFEQSGEGADQVTRLDWHAQIEFGPNRST